MKAPSAQGRRSGRQRPARHRAAGQVAARLLSSLQRPIELSDSGRLVSLTVSIGLALGRRESVAEVLRAADRALYEAKRAGGGCWVPFAVGMQAGMQDRVVAQA